MSDLKRDFVSEKIDYVIQQLINGVEQSTKVSEAMGVPNAAQQSVAQKMLIRIARIALRKEILGENPSMVKP